MPAALQNQHGSHADGIGEFVSDHVDAGGAGDRGLWLADQRAIESSQSLTRGDDPSFFPRQSGVCWFAVDHVHDG